MLAIVGTVVALRETPPRRAASNTRPRHRAEPPVAAPLPAARPPGATDATSLRIQGAVLAGDGMRLQSLPRIKVEKAILPGSLLATQATDQGQFDFGIPLSGSIRMVVVYAEASTRGRTVRSLPQLVNLDSPLEGLGLTLRLLPLARISFRVVTPDGDPVPFGRAMVCETLNPQVRVEPWQHGSFQPSDRDLSCDRMGRARVWVRPGLVRVLVARGNAPWSKGVERAVGTVSDIDLGDIPVVRETRRFRVQVRDPSGAPVPEAVLRLADRTIRFGAERPGDEIEHLRADTQGRIAIPAMDRALLPLKGAVGSRTHFVAPLVLEDVRMESLDVVLQPRPRVSITLSTAGGAPFPEVPQWNVIAATPHADAETGRRLEPWESLELLISDPYVREVEANKGRYEAVLRGPGEYELLGLLKCGLRLRRKVHVGRGPPSPIRFEVPDGRPVRFSLRDSGEAIAPPVATIQLHLSSSWSTDSPPVVSEWNAARERESGPIWIPREYDTALLLGGGPFHAPWKPVTLSIPQEASTPLEVVTIARGGGVVRLIAMVGDVHLGNAVFLVSGRTVIATRKRRDMFTVRADDTGVARVRLRAGAYGAMIFPGVGLAGWTRFEVGEGAEIEVAIPLAAQ